MAIIRNAADFTPVTDEQLTANLFARKSGEECVQYIESELDKFPDDEHKRRALGVVWEWLNGHPLAEKKEKVVARAGKQLIKVETLPLNPVAEDAYNQCDSILSLIDDIPEAGWDFGDSVKEKVDGIQSTIVLNNWVTDAQQEALDNMQAGVERWLD
tara:strand:- start:534 stop:1004 length:471 start_codon:yes stop_codon:yes gene_type:complete